MGPRHSNIVVLEGISNADNVGAVFRNARAFGVDGVVVGPGCCDPLYRKAIRVSIGAALEVPYASVGPPGFVTDLLTLKRAGFMLVALTPAADAVDLDSFAAGPRPERVALVVGNEGEGLSADALRASDVRVRIAMAPGVDSLNVSTATGIALHRLWDRKSE
jgi:tRNA G18 (ribose-2'-O)-methylase SpoU